VSRIMAHYSHVIYACYQNMLQNLLASCWYATNTFAERLYASQQTTRSVYTINALFFRCTLMILQLSRMRRNWLFYIYRACVETSIGTFITPGNVSATPGLFFHRKRLSSSADENIAPDISWWVAEAQGNKYSLAKAERCRLYEEPKWHIH